MCNVAHFATMQMKIRGSLQTPTLARWRGATVEEAAARGTICSRSRAIWKPLLHSSGFSTCSCAGQAGCPWRMAPKGWWRRKTQKKSILMSDHYLAWARQKYGQAVFWLSYTQNYTVKRNGGNLRSTEISNEGRNCKGKEGESLPPPFTAAERTNHRHLIFYSFSQPRCLFL